MDVTEVTFIYCSLPRSLLNPSNYPLSSYPALKPVIPSTETPAPLTVNKRPHTSPNPHPPPRMHTVKPRHPQSSTVAGKAPAVPPPPPGRGRGIGKQTAERLVSLSLCSYRWRCMGSWRVSPHLSPGLSCVCSGLGFNVNWQTGDSWLTLEVQLFSHTIHISRLLW